MIRTFVTSLYRQKGLENRTRCIYTTPANESEDRRPTHKYKITKAGVQSSTCTDVPSEREREITVVLLYCICKKRYAIFLCHHNSSFRQKWKLGVNRLAVLVRQTYKHSHEHTVLAMRQREDRDKRSVVLCLAICILHPLFCYQSAVLAKVATKINIFLCLTPLNDKPKCRSAAVRSINISKCLLFVFGRGDR